MRCRLVLVIAATGAVAAVGCESGEPSSSTPTSASVTSIVAATTSTTTIVADPNAEPAVPDGYELTRHGTVTLLTRRPVDPASAPTAAPTTMSSSGSTEDPGIAIGDAMTATRMARPLAARPGHSTRSVRVTFACLASRDDMIESIAYELRDTGLVVSAHISGVLGGPSCEGGEGATIELPLDAAWVPGTMVEAGELATDQN